jgi:ABC-type multidrug transport system fused ATPase/permease subunit
MHMLATTRKFSKLQFLFCFAARGVAMPAFARGYLKWRHLPPPSEADNSATVWNRWDAFSTRSLFKRALQVFRPQLLYLVAIQLCSLAAQLASPLALQFFLQLLEQPRSAAAGDSDARYMYMLAFCIYLSTAVAALLRHKYWYDASRVGIHFCVAQSVAVLDTAVNRAAGSPAAMTKMSLANLVTVDAQRAENTAAVPFGIWAILNTLITNTFASVWLWRLLSWPGLAATILCWLTPVIAKLLSKAVRDATTALQGKRDARSNMTRAALASVLTLKSFAWAQSWKARILRLRSEEHSALVHMLLAKSVVTLVGRVLPSFASVAAFTLYVFVIHRPLMPSVAFSALVWYNMLYSSTAMLGHLQNTWAQLQASTRRVEDFLASRNQKYAPAQLRVPNMPCCIGEHTPSSSSCCTFGFPSACKPLVETSHNHQMAPFQITLQDVALPKIGLVVFHGQLGSGKTSALQAIAGELVQTGGTVPDSFQCAKALLQQPPWLGNMSVRENITLLGDSFSCGHYNAVCGAVQLDQVASRFIGADEDGVGEGHASSLSGGERARVALARCLYFFYHAKVFDLCTSTQILSSATALFSIVALNVANC